MDRAGGLRLFSSLRQGGRYAQIHAARLALLTMLAVSAYAPVYAQGQGGHAPKTWEGRDTITGRQPGTINRGVTPVRAQG